MIWRRQLTAALLAATLGLGACAEGVAPVAGERRTANADRGGALGPLSLDREQEAKIGREQHPKVLAQFGGAYEDRSSRPTSSRSATG
jgi:predicted Zn-dependent protease